MSGIGRDRVRDALLEFLATPRFAAALSTVIVAMAFLSFPIRQLTGWAGILGILVGLLVLAAASLVARRGTIEWRGLLPVSLLAFLGWSAASLVWSQYQWSTLGGVAYQWAFALLAVYVALVRDVIQVVRIFGDVLRVVLITSVAAEFLVGVLLDTDLPLLRIAGNLEFGGPIQGIEGTRNQLGLVAILALVTFGTEALTKSVRRSTAILSLVGVAIVLLLVQSPVSYGVLAVLGLASLALLVLRRATEEARPYLQAALLVTGLAAVALAWGFRGRLLDTLNAATELQFRVRVWRDVLLYAQQNQLEGWGWVGSWRPEVAPFYAIDPSVAAHDSALNAFLDVWFQLGLVGLLVFLTLLGLAFGRSWILAARQRSRAYVWPALVLVTLLVTSLAESSALIEAGWMTLVICTVKAAQQLSWRRALPE